MRLQLGLLLIGERHDCDDFQHMVSSRSESPAVASLAEMNGDVSWGPAAHVARHLINSDAAVTRAARQAFPRLAAEPFRHTRSLLRAHFGRTLHFIRG
jgi:hypothetical protein